MSIKKSNKKFKYVTTFVLQHSELNKMGQEGWELIAVDGKSMYFKMEI